MIRVSIEGRNGTARFDVAVTAESIERVLELVGRTNSARGALRARFPLEPEGFFADGPTLAGVVETEHPKEIAA